MITWRPQSSAAGVRSLRDRTELTHWAVAGHPVTAAVTPNWAPGSTRCHLELSGPTRGHSRLGSPWTSVPYQAVPLPLFSYLTFLTLHICGAGVLSRQVVCIPLAVWISLTCPSAESVRHMPQEWSWPQCQAGELWGQEQGFASNKLAPMSAQCPPLHA